MASENGDTVGPASVLGFRPGDENREDFEAARALCARYHRLPVSQISNTKVFVWMLSSVLGKLEQG